MVGARSRTRSGVPDPVDAPHHRGASLGAGHLLLALLLVFSAGQYPCHARGGGHGRDVPPGGGKTAGGKCMDREREALLAVRDDVWGGITDPYLQQRLPTWERDGDCCRWKGVACDHRSGHVVTLDLRRPTGREPRRITEISKVNPSLFSLGSLRYLDLSGNFFGGAPLPSLIGSLVYLEYLNISQAKFSTGFVGNPFGRAPLPRFNGTKDFSSKIVKNNLHWLSRLSHLQYLDMSGNDLFAAYDWLQVISMLPSLSVLHLQYCYLPDPPSTLLLPLGNFTSLATLDLGYSIPAGYSTWPLWLSNISGLTTLVLAPLNCTIPPDAFKNMKHLEVLRMEGKYDDDRYGFTGLIPRSLWTLDELKYLYLSGHDLRIGSYVGQLSSLQELALFGVVGRLPDSLGNITGLRSLSIQVDASASNIELPGSIGNLVGLKTLRLSGVRTTGEVLRNIGDHLCNLTELVIDGNNANGAVVKGAGFLELLSECNGGSALEHLEITGNGYGGHLPDQLGKLKNLRHVILHGNSIVGSIPASIGELESLTHLDLSDNQFSGHVPSSIGKLSNLTFMSMSYNRLEGALSEAHFSHLSQLQDLDLTHNPALSLNTSQTWIPPFQLFTLSMSECHLGPEFPKWLQTQKRLNWLDLSSNNISCSLQDDFFKKWSSKNMLYFNLARNDIKGIIPASLLSVSTTIDLSFNSFEASPLVLNVSLSESFLLLSHNLISGLTFVNTGGFEDGKLKYLDLSYNKIQGSIPSTICQVESLVVLDLSYNHFSGQLPNCWKSASLEIMKISNNSLVGQIPSSIGMLSQLKVLHLDKNALTGLIPLSLKNCILLQILDLGENKLSGEIPYWLGQSLSSLKILSLRSNMFHGYLPMSLSELQTLHILDLACNKFSGSILLPFHYLSEMVEIEQIHAPRIYHRYGFDYSGFTNYRESMSIVPKGSELVYTSNLPLVTIIDLSNNSFSGEFPREITSLRGLHFLNLSRNHLSGRIPENIDHMSQLESLDLSFNQLSGMVPSTMSNMHFLSVFNVSYNSLSGKIPLGQIQHFDQSSFIGNHDLCGAPTLGPCPGDATPFAQDPFQTSEGDAASHEDESYMAWFYVSLGPGFVTGFLGFLGVLSLMRRSWRIAYFRFFDNLGDTLYVIVMVRYARLKVKLSAWRRGGSAD